MPPPAPLYSCLLYTSGYLTEAQIPTALANLGYIANTLFWGPATPTTSYAITGDITFVADFNAEGVITEEPPVPPVTPVGPTAPEEGPEETIDEPETPLAPAEPEAPAEEPAEEEIEEADTPVSYTHLDVYKRQGPDARRPHP